MTETPTEKLDRYIRARYPVVMIQTHEEVRVEREIAVLAKQRNRDFFAWTATQGIEPIISKDENTAPPDPDMTGDPYAALTTIANWPVDAEPTLFLLKDLHRYFEDAMIVRHIRDIGHRFETCRHTMILMAPTIEVPSDLEKAVVVLDWPLPEESDLATILTQCEEDLPSGIEVTLNGNREQVIQAMRGLTEFEATSVLLSAIAATGELGDNVIPHIVSEKRQIIRKSGVLEFFEAEVTMADVGGLDNLKEYAARKRAAFSQDARDFGIDPPKGVLLVGIPGTGKSLSAKAIAGGQMPLIRMDIGALFGSLVGQSEANMRQALKVTEAVSPCVLWVDEIEKALGGVGGGELDGGTTTRVFGTLLTWMQETTAPVYVVATANEVRALRPELLRRFDDLFFVDLPNEKSRMEIAGIHLAKRNQNPNDFDLSEIADATYGFTGAEIEKTIKAAMEHAFISAGDGVLTLSNITSAAESIIPIAKTMENVIDDLLTWAKDRAIPAGEPLEKRTSTPGGRRVLETP